MTPEIPKSDKTICDLIIRELPNRLRADLEDFRISYEQVHGPTDLSRFYTTMRSYEEQQWLLEHHPGRYWNGLPPFVRSYMENVIGKMARNGTLDDLPDLWLLAYQSGFLGRAA